MQFSPNPTQFNDPDIAEVLQESSNEDISLLIDVITDSGDGRISLSSESCKRLVAAKDSGAKLADRVLIEEELTRFGGNTLMNLFRRGAGVPYREILGDVASHVQVAKKADASCAELEMAVIGRLVEQSVERMDDSDRMRFFESFGGRYVPGTGPLALAAQIAALGKTGSSAYQLATAVASSTMSHLVGRGVAVAGTGALSRTMSVMAGPIGWAITGLWTAYDLASPAYRVTVPCVIQIGYMRQKLLQGSACPQCGTPPAPGSKFCPECGTNLTKR